MSEPLRRRHRFWTTARVKEAHAIYVSEGLTIVEVAKRYGRAPTPLHKAFKREGLATRKRAGYSWNEPGGRAETFKNEDPIVRGEGHRCIFALGECLGCGAQRTGEVA